MYILDFDNIAPDCVESRKVETTEWRGLSIPADAMQFSFSDESLQWVGPHGYVTEEADVGPVEAMQAKYPDTPVHLSALIVERDVKELALVTWSYPGDSRYDDRMLVPLFDGVVVVSRADGSAVWPAN